MISAREFLAECKSHLGYRERESNDTIFGEWFGDNPAPWCAIFLSYCAHKVDAEKEIGRQSSAQLWAYWFAGNGRFGHTPRVGALIFFDWTRTHRMENITHVGVVEAVNPDGSITTIEGNTGDGVYRRIRSTNYIVGYGYPVYTPPEPVVPRTLRLDDHGPAVRKLQRHLNAAPVMDLAVDGAFGPKTLKSTKAYQTINKVKADGVVGPVTWRKLLTD